MQVDFPQPAPRSLRKEIAMFSQGSAAGLCGEAILVIGVLIGKIWRFIPDDIFMFGYGVLCFSLGIALLCLLVMTFRAVMRVTKNIRFPRSWSFDLGVAIGFVAMGLVGITFIDRAHY